jgi:hypothetical protein
MSTAMTWIVTDRPALIPQWQRSAAVDSDGTVFVPAVIAGNEMAVLMAAGWDGNVPAVMDDGHVYLPAQWIAKEYPDTAEVCHLIESKCHAHLSKETPR